MPRRHVNVPGVAEVTVTIGEREPARLKVVVQRLHPVHRGQLGIAQDVERLAVGDATAGGRRHAVDVEAAVIHLRRVSVQRVVSAQVGQRHRTGSGQQRGARCQRRVLRGVDHIGADRATVERADPVLADLPVGLREVRIAQR